MLLFVIRSVQSNNDVGDGGAFCLAEALKSNASVEYLNLVCSSAFNQFLVCLARNAYW